MSATTKIARRSLIMAVVTAVMLALGQPSPAADLDTIQKGKLVVALNGDMPMTGLQDNKLIGIDGEIMAWVAGALGLDVVPAMMEWSAEIASVQARRVDTMHGGMGWSAQRAEVLLMTDPVYYFRQQVTQKKGTKWCSMADLQGKTIGVVTGVGTIPEIRKIQNVTLRLFDTSDAVIRDLLAGRLDAVFVDPAVMQYAIQKNPSWDLHSIPVCESFRDDMPILTSVRYSVFGINKAAKSLHDAMNLKIAELWSGCGNQKIAQKYGLGEPHWFDPGNQKNYRQGVDRSADWALPKSPASCPK